MITKTEKSTPPTVNGRLYQLVRPRAFWAVVNKKGFPLEIHLDLPAAFDSWTRYLDPSSVDIVAVNLSIKKCAGSRNLAEELMDDWLKANREL